MMIGYNTSPDDIVNVMELNAAVNATRLSQAWWFYGRYRRYVEEAVCCIVDKYAIGQFES